jgi:hypothetical protein
MGRVSNPVQQAPRRRHMARHFAALAALVVLLAGLCSAGGAGIATCPTVPANAVSIAAVFGASTRDASNAAVILSAALSSANASAASLFWAPSLRFYENQSVPIGAAGIDADSEVAAFLASAVSCNVSFIVSTSCASGAIQLFVARNATFAGAATPAVVHAAVCSAYQTPSQLAFAAATSKLPPLLRVSHSISAHAELAARTLRSFNWTRCGVLLDIDQYDPALLPALDRMLPLVWIAVPVVDVSALANASSSPLPSAAASPNVTAELGSLVRQFFRSTATIDVLRLYARSLREQNAKVILVFCGADLLPRLWVRACESVTSVEARAHVQFVAIFVEELPIRCRCKLSVLHWFLPECRIVTEDLFYMIYSFTHRLILVLFFWPLLFPTGSSPCRGHDGQRCCCPCRRITSLFRHVFARHSRTIYCFLLYRCQ